ncbi:hypothetical protein [Actinokineospora fastidiosa]|uniref:Uncharacterized protein n=1 Tax=Actinokineospora fastidiosa TaxID=1816 RepID=A0A918GQY3_9PSEU|nr:hypothetical protein [Actinokineospora fastidiosa]GGS54704.1 hypothetical protein GCM10010171_57320 [Actinokineospora fastidiosa]
MGKKDVGTSDGKVGDEAELSKDEHLGSSEVGGDADELPEN